MWRVEIGWPSRTRTYDPLVNSQLLYRLSYWPSLRIHLYYKITQLLSSRQVMPDIRSGCFVEKIKLLGVSGALLLKNRVLVDHYRAA